MKKEAPVPPAGTTAADNALQMRRLLHDMNNGMEIIIQTSYLLGTLPLTEDGKQWLKLLEQGVEQVTALNRQLRELIRNEQPV